MELPKLLVGTERMGSVVPGIDLGRDQTFRHLDALVDIGCTGFDLAASYQLGGTERLFGAWMRARKNREKLFLVGKGAHPYPIVRPNRLTPRDLEGDLDDSLRRLETDRLDLYLVHRDHPGVSLEPIVEKLASFVKQGKVRAYGVSNFHHDRIARMNEIATKSGLPSPSASSPQFSLVRWTKPQFPGTVSISHDRAFYEKTKMPVLAWSPLGRGYFGGTTRGVYDTPENARRKDRAIELARKKECKPSQIALAWLFAQPFPVHAIVWSQSIDNMKSNLAATKIALTEEETRFLENG